MSAVAELRDYPAPAWDTDEAGRCARCSEPCKRYGHGGNPLCRRCFPEVAGKWGPGVRQKGYNA
jgi:ribosomal protein S14